MWHGSRSADIEAEQLGLPAVVEPDTVATRGASGCSGVLVLGCDGCGTKRRVGVACRSACERCPWRGDGRVGATLELVPRVPVRHWTFRPAPEDRERLADPKVLRAVTRVFVAEVLHTVRSLAPPGDGLHDDPTDGGAVSVVHRGNAALELDVHLHALVLDGVYRFGDTGEAVFVPLRDDPDPAALAALTARLHKKLRRLLRGETGRGGAVQQQAVSGPPAREVARRIRAPADAAPKRRARSGQAAVRNGLRVHAAGAIGADDRRALARVARYITRPIPAPDAFSTSPSGAIRYRLEHPFADGTTHVEFDPASLSARLDALLPRGARADVNLHGILAPRAANRHRVLPRQVALFDSDRRRAPRPVRATREGVEVSRPDADVEPAPVAAMSCERCGKPMRLLAIESLRGPPGG